MAKEELGKRANGVFRDEDFPSDFVSAYFWLKKQGVTEGAGNIGASIKALCQKIYNAGDDEFEYFYHDSPIFAQYWDEYEGDLDSIIAEVDPAELQVMHDELESYVEQAGLTEANYSPMTKDSMKADKIRSLKNLIAIAKEQGRGVRAQELELELKKLDARKEPVNEIDPHDYESDEDYYRDLEAGRYQGVPKKPYNPDWDDSDDKFMQKWYQERGLEEGKTLKDYFAEAAALRKEKS